jgi:glutathione synthetase
VYASRTPSEWEQRMMLGIFRSDYLIYDYNRDAGSNGTNSTVVVQSDTVSDGQPFRQVEINTISVAFPALSSRVGRVHLKPLDHHLRGTVQFFSSEVDVVEGLAAAHDWWRTQYGGEAAVVFVVQKGERNAGDQRLLAEGLAGRGVKSVRLTLADLATGLRVDDTTHQATVETPDGTVPVSLFYLRALYDIRDFEDDACWAAREQIERCTAVKCPSLPYHLCTWKRVQQALSDATGLREFADEADAKLLHSCMVKQYLLHRTDPATNAAIEQAIADPRQFVVKTQKEGTGGVIVGEDVRTLLSIPPTDSRYDQVRREHLLMERIPARRRPGRVLRDSQVVDVSDLECEVGSYGVLLSDGELKINKAAGYLVRTKSGSHEGGGVMSGVAALDTIAIVE